MQEGGCLCGAVRYVLAAEPLTTGICHCTHCQRSSGSAFSVNLLLRSADVTVTGPVSEYADVGDSGAPVRRCFCGTCGSSLMSILAPASGLVAVKAGTLDDKAAVLPRAQFWGRSAQPWVEALPSIERFETVRPAA